MDGSGFVIIRKASGIEGLRGVSCVRDARKGGQRISEKKVDDGGMLSASVVVEAMETMDGYD